MIKNERKRRALLKKIITTGKFLLVRDIEFDGEERVIIETIRMKRYAINCGIPGMKEDRTLRVNVGDRYYQIFYENLCKKKKPRLT